MLLIRSLANLGQYWVLPLIYAITASIFFIAAVTIVKLGRFVPQPAVRMESKIATFFGTAYSAFRFNAIYIFGYHVSVKVVEKFNNFLFSNISPDVVAEYQTIAMINTHIACGSAFAFYCLFFKYFMDLTHRLCMHCNVFATAWLLSFVQLHFEILYNYQKCKKDPTSCQSLLPAQGAINSLAYFWILTAVFQCIYALCLSFLYLVIHFERPFNFIHHYVPSLFNFLNPRAGQFDRPREPPPRPPPPFYRVRRVAPAG